MTLYEAIFKRKSVRSYRMEELPEELLTNIRKYEKEIDRLHPELKYELMILNALTEEVPLKGLFRVKAPYYMVLFIEDKDGHMEEAGYILEQLVLFMTTKGIGTCYQGGARLEGDFCPKDFRQAMVVAFGWADTTIYRQENQAKRLSMNEIAFIKESINDDVRLLLRAARMAPSAINDQPWRMMVYNNRIHIFAKRIFGAKEASDRERMDIGIMAAHFSVAAEEFWIDTKFQISDVVMEKSFKNNYYITTLCIER